MDWKNKCSRQTLSMKSSMIRELVEMTQNVAGMISFAGGFPSPETFPTDILSQLYQEVVREKGKQILQYGSTGGENNLKEVIISEDGPDIEPDEIMICTGATNGIFNTMMTFLEPGDYVIAEAPSFLGAIVSFEAAGAEVLPVGMEPDGINIDELREIIGKKDTRKIKFIYTIPDFQNPTGITMSNEKREKLIEIAIENGIIILEDDPYSKLRLKGEPQKSLFRIAREKYHNKEVVICVRSFSKLLGPGMRIAYTLADKELMKYMNSWSQKINVTTDRISQNVVAAFMEKGLLKPQIESIRNIYRPLCDKMVSSLNEFLPDEVRFVSPEGGMFLWLELPERMNVDELFKKAVQEKVAFIPGSKFYPSGYEKHNGLRLNFSYPTVEQIETGIKRLSAVFS